MVWSEFITDSITLPFGATTGARIVISGTSIIEYDAANNIITQIDPVNGNLLGGILTVAGIKTALNGIRLEINSTSNTNSLNFFSANPNELLPGNLSVGDNGTFTDLNLQTPDASYGVASLFLSSPAVLNGGATYARINAAQADMGPIHWANTRITLDNPVHAPYVKQIGTVNFPALSTGTGKGGSVAFPIPFVDSPPAVVMTANSSRITCSISAVTLNGFSYFSSNWSPATSGLTTANWIAIAP